MAAQTKAQLTTTLTTNITDPLNKQNTAARVREIIQNIIDSMYNSSTPITSTYIPQGHATGLVDGTWQYSTNDLLPVTTGSNLGSSSKRIGTGYINTVNYATDLVFSENGTERGRFLTGGNVGIGTATPNAKLEVSKTSGEVMRLHTAAFGDPKMTWYDDIYELFNIQARRSSSNTVFLSSSGVDNFRINGANAGFGYYDGNTRLYINNTSLTYSLIVDGGGANAITVLRSGDKVGIGTTSPEQKFDVLGIAQIRRFQDATGGGTLQPSNFFQLQSAYWTGAASSSVSMKLRNDALSTTPTYKLAIYDNADVERFAIHNNGVAVFEEFTIATLPAASTYQAGWIMVTDETGGYIPCFSDGTNWRRVTDRAIAS